LRDAFCGLMLLLGVLGAADVRAAGLPPAPSPDQRAAIAAKLYSDIRIYYAHWQNIDGLDLDAAFGTYLAAAMNATDRLDYDLQTMAFLAKFNNGLTRFSDQWLLDAYPALPFSVRRVAEDWVVTKSNVDALKPGDVIAQVDGTPTEAFYQAHARYLSGTQDEVKRNQLFSTPVLFPSPLSLGLAGGQTVAIEPGGAPPAPAPETSGKWLKPDEVALIAIPSFATPQFETRALELLKEYGAATTLVLDLRGNGGGAMPTALLAALMNKPYRGWAESVAFTIGHLRLQSPNRVIPAEAAEHPTLTLPPITTQPAAAAYARQLILLIDGGCVAACEDFVMPFKDNGRATLIGEPTAGGAGAAYVETLGDGMSASIGSTRLAWPSGASLEGIGIAPDVAVAPRVADIKAGLDPIMAKVLIQIAPSAP